MEENQDRQPEQDRQPGPSTGRQKTRLPGCGGTGSGERTNPIPTKCIRQSRLPGSQWSGSRPSSSLDPPWEWQESASQLPKAGAILREG